MPGRVLTEGLDLPSELTSTPRQRRELRDAARRAERRPRRRPTPTSRPRSSSTCARSATSTRARRRATATWRRSTSRRASTRRPRASTRSWCARAPTTPACARATRARSGRSASYDEAYAELGRAIALEPANPEAYHNRGAILEKRGDPKAAAREYQTALRYAPDYEPSRSALARLGGGARRGRAADARTRSSPRRSPSRRTRPRCAATIAGATQKLDEAERIAPRFALVAHYRANIAYLQGDRAGAIKALQARRRARARQSAVSHQPRAVGGALLRQALRRASRKGVGMVNVSSGGG